MKAGRKQVIGYIAIILGCILGLLLLRVLVFGPLVNFWMFLGDLLLFGGVGAYLIYVGRRAVYSAKGQPQQAARFGWGRMLLGAILLLSSANSHFHLYPVQSVVKPLEASDPTQAAAMRFTDVIISIGCAALIVSGIWKGLRRQPAANRASAASMKCAWCPISARCWQMWV